jgi:hypothetical protein
MIAGAEAQAFEELDVPVQQRSCRSYNLRKIQRWKQHAMPRNPKLRRKNRFLLICTCARD